jgi:hypothetical protein
MGRAHLIAALAVPAATLLTAPRVRADSTPILLADATTAKLAIAPGLLAHLDDPDLLERRWPSLPSDHAESEEDVITDHLSELGNQLGKRMTLLSDSMIGLHVDGRGQRAKLRFGTGTGHYLAFKLDSDWYFSDGKARISARVQLGLAGHELALQLPAMEMEPTSYHGEDGVMLKLPLFERRW